MFSEVRSKESEVQLFLAFSCYFTTGSKMAAQPLDIKYDEPEAKDVRSLQSGSILDYAGIQAKNVLTL